MDVTSDSPEPQKYDEPTSNIDAEALFLARVSEANRACQCGEFEKAILLYGKSIEQNNTNHVLYSNRAAAYIRLGNFSLALEDALASAQLQPNWPKAYYRQGVALQCMGRHSEALAAFATALAQDQKSPQLLQAITEAAINSPYKASLEPLLLQLKKMELDMDPFVIIAIIGQELLAVGEVTSSICVLECALRIGTENQKLHGSILSALSSAYWKMGDSKRALEFMQQDLEQVQELNDQPGLCRAHGNLGNAYYSQGQYKEALEHHRSQLAIAMKLKDRSFAAAALTSLGHVYVSMGDNANALASHKRCALLRQQLNDRLAEGRELGNVGTVYTIMGDFENAVLCHLEHLRISQELENNSEMSRSYSNLGSLYHNMRKFDLAIEHYEQALSISKQLSDTSTQCRSLAGLGHAYRAKGDFDEALKCHTKQLKLSIELGDRAMEGRARSNLGVTLQQKGQYQEALEFHKDHLQICGELDDKEGEGRACGNIGNAYHSLGQYERAIKYQKLGLALAKELRDKQSEATMHGNLAVAFQALGDEEDALQHYTSHLEMARVLKDMNGECLAEGNLGNFYSTRGDYLNAAHHFENQLSVAEKLSDRIQMCKGSHNLAYVNFSLGKFDEAIEFYERNIAIAEETGDTSTLMTAHCNLGLAYSAIKDFRNAYLCQERYLELVRSCSKGSNGTLLRALSNIGEACLALENFENALSFFQEQLDILKDSKPDMAFANALGAAGRALQGLQRLSEASDYFVKEAELRRNLQDAVGLTDCLSNVGTVVFEQGDIYDAKRYFAEQLEVADSISNTKEKIRALGSLGLCCFETKEYDECIKLLQSQLKLHCEFKGLEQDEAKTYGILGDCYSCKGDFVEGVNHYRGLLERSVTKGNIADEDWAYKGLGNCHKELGNFSEALVCFEKRLVLSQDLGVTVLLDVYASLGCIHCLLGNYEQSISYYEKELHEAKAQCNLSVAAKAYGELGDIHLKMREFKNAQRFYEDQLQLGESLQDFTIQVIACKGIGYASLLQSRFKQAAKYYERALELCREISDKCLKFNVLTGLGKLYHLMKKESKANEMLKKAAELAELLQKVEYIVPAYFRLGVVFYVQGRYALAIENFERSVLAGRHVSCTLNVSEIDVKCFETAARKMMQRSLIMIKQEFKALVVSENDFGFPSKEGTSEEETESILSKSMENELNKLKRGLEDIVVYYGVVIGQLYIWFLLPGGFLKKFLQIPLTDGYTDDDLACIDVDEVATECSRHTNRIIDKYIEQLRENLGIEKHQKVTSIERRHSLGGDLADLVIENASVTGKSSRIGLPAKVQHPFLSSTPKAVFNFSLRPKGKQNSSKGKTNWDSALKEAKPLKSLYQLLISPLKRELNELMSGRNQIKEVCFVVPSELILIPFSLLLDEGGDQFLRDEFRIRLATSLRVLLKTDQNESVVPSEYEYCVIGSRCRNVGTETHIVAEVLETEPLYGSDSSKEETIKQFKTAKICHLASDVLWSNEAIMLGDLEVARSVDNSPTSDPEIESLESEGRVVSPPLPSALLSVNDLKRLGSAKPHLVIFGLSSSSWSENICAEALYSIASTFLGLGVQTVITSLWGVDSGPLKTFLTGFYGAYLNGEPSSKAFDYGVLSVKRDQAFGHPSCWGGFALFGQNSSLQRRKGSLTHVLYLLLEKPSRDAIKVLLHLVEKARQRIAQCRRSSMYTAESSIRGKVGDVLGWKDLLTLVGFRFEKARNGLPDSVFFPTADHCDILNRCSNTLYAFLGLNRNGLDALSKLRSAREVSMPLVNLLHEVIESFSKDVSYSQVSLCMKIWRVPGCHEFLSSLGFDLMGVGREDVLLRSGKSSLRRPLQCALQAVMDLFEVDNPSIDFMFNLGGKAYSETQLGENSTLSSTSPAHQSKNGGRNGYHPMRKTRSTPINSENRNGHTDSNNNIRRKGGPTNGHNGSHYLGAKVGLFGGMDSEPSEGKVEVEDIGASARRLRMRGSGIITSKSSLDGSPEVLLCKEDRVASKGSRLSLQRFSTMETLSCLNESIPVIAEQLPDKMTPTSDAPGSIRDKKIADRSHLHESFDSSADQEVEKYFNQETKKSGQNAVTNTPNEQKRTRSSNTRKKVPTSEVEKDATTAKEKSPVVTHSAEGSENHNKRNGKREYAGYWGRFKDIDSILHEGSSSYPDEMDQEMNVLEGSEYDSTIKSNISRQRSGAFNAGRNTNEKDISYLFSEQPTPEKTFQETMFNGSDELPILSVKSTTDHLQSTVSGHKLKHPVQHTASSSDSISDLRRNSEDANKEGARRRTSGNKNTKGERKLVTASFGFVPTAVSPINASESKVASASTSSLKRESVEKRLPKKLLELKTEELLQSGDMQASLC